MKNVAQPLTQRAAWRALENHLEKVRQLHLRTLFADDLKRGERLTADAVGVYLDYSKNRVTDETLKLLTQLAQDYVPAARVSGAGEARLLLRHVLPNILGPVTDHGNYADFVNVNGRTVLVRTPDGIHFTTDGSYVIADEMLARLKRDWHLGK